METSVQLFLHRGPVHELRDEPDVHVSPFSFRHV